MATTTHICATCIPLLSHNRTAPSCTETPCKNCALRQVTCKATPNFLSYELGELLFTHSRWANAVENGDKTSAYKAKDALKERVMDFSDLMEEAENAVLPSAVRASTVAPENVEPAAVVAPKVSPKSAITAAKKKPVKEKVMTSTSGERQAKATLTPPVKKEKAKDAIQTGGVNKIRKPYAPRKPKESKQNATNERRLLPKPVTGIAVKKGSEEVYDGLLSTSRLINKGSYAMTPLKASSDTMQSRSHEALTNINSMFQASHHDQDTLPSIIDTTSSIHTGPTNNPSPDIPQAPSMHPSAFEFDHSPEEWHNILSSDFQHIQNRSTSSTSYSSPNSHHEGLLQLHFNTGAEGTVHLLSSPYASQADSTAESNTEGIGNQLNNDLGKHILEQLQTLNSTMSGVYEMMRLQLMGVAGAGAGAGAGAAG
jgi:hypothetical protein